MHPLRQTLRLQPEEDRVLRGLYQRYRIPSDQYKGRPEEASSFLREWNSLTRRADCWEDVIHYIVTKRKKKLWVTFGDDHELLADPAYALLTPSEWRHLEDIYQRIVLARERASDHLVFDRDLAMELTREFARLAKRQAPSNLLIGLIIRKRKRGEWLTLAHKLPQVASRRLGQIAASSDQEKA